MSDQFKNKVYDVGNKLFTELNYDYIKNNIANYTPPIINNTGRICHGDQYCTGHYCSICSTRVNQDTVVDNSSPVFTRDKIDDKNCANWGGSCPANHSCVMADAHIKRFGGAFNCALD